MDTMNCQMLCSKCLFPLGFSAAQAPGDSCHAQSAEEDRGSGSSHGGGANPGQQIHRTQHRGSGPTVGPTRPAGHEDATQPGTTDPSQVTPHNDILLYFMIFCRLAIKMEQTC